MRKADYQQPPYQRAEWRMGLRVMGCQNVTVEGLRIESSGGDGIYIGSSGKNRWCEDVTIRDCVCFDNHRQGMSVISAQNLLVENCQFTGTSGTPPEAGIDFEADSEDERFVNCVVRNCTFESNSGHAILIYLKPMTSNSEPVSIRVENCHSRMGTPGMTPADFENRETSGWSGMSVGAIGDDGPDGLIEFLDCTTQNSGKEGVKVFDKSADRVKVRFVRCKWSNPWVSRHRSDSSPCVPVLIQLRRPEITRRPGGIEFIDCHVFDDRFAPVVEYTQNDSHLGLFDVTGNLTVHSPHQPRLKLGPDTTNVDLKIIAASKE
ncbi:MAG: right-handed parallel beta-helix repeat-containing protein [Planctomycetaceae bacterium]